MAQEKHRFSSSSDYQQQQSQHHQIQHQQYAHGDFKQDGHTAYYDRPSSGGAGAGAGGSTVPILSRTLSGTGSGAKEEASSPPPSTLPPLNLSCEKGANISPLPSRRSDAKFSLSRTASKEDVYGQDTSSCKGGNASPNQPGAASGAAGGSGGGGRFPPIMLNRSRSGSQQNLNAPPTSGRNLSGSNLNTNHNFNTGSSSSSSREESKGTGEGDEMDVDSSSPPRHGVIIMPFFFLSFLCLLL